MQPNSDPNPQLNQFNNRGQPNGLVLVYFPLASSLENIQYVRGNFTNYDSFAN